MDRVEALTEPLRDLVDWAENMGGWDAPCWARAREVLSGGQPAPDADDTAD